MGILTPEEIKSLNLSLQSPTSEPTGSIAPVKEWFKPFGHMIKGALASGASYIASALQKPEDTTALPEKQEETWQSRWQREAERVNREIAEEVEKNPYKDYTIPVLGMSFKDVATFGQSAAATGLAIGSSIAGSLIGAAAGSLKSPVVGTAAGIAGGLAASTAAMHRMTETQQLYDSLANAREFLTSRGIPYTKEVEDELKKTFIEKSTEVANWEAGLEGLGTTLELAVIGGLAKKVPILRHAVKLKTPADFGKAALTQRVLDFVKEAAKTGAQVAGTELITEALTYTGQEKPLYEMGLDPRYDQSKVFSRLLQPLGITVPQTPEEAKKPEFKPPDWLSLEQHAEALKEVWGPTLLTTALIGAGAATVRSAKGMYDTFRASNTADITQNEIRNISDKGLDDIFKNAVLQPRYEEDPIRRQQAFIQFLNDSKYEIINNPEKYQAFISDVEKKVEDEIARTTVPTAVTQEEKQRLFNDIMTSELTDVWNTASRKVFDRSEIVNRLLDPNSNLSFLLSSDGKELLTKLYKPDQVSLEQVFSEFKRELEEFTPAQKDYLTRVVRASVADSPAEDKEDTIKSIIQSGRKSGILSRNDEDTLMAVHRLLPDQVKSQLLDPVILDQVTDKHSPISVRDLFENVFRTAQSERLDKIVRDRIDKLKPDIPPPASIKPFIDSLSDPAFQENLKSARETLKSAGGFKPTFGDFLQAFDSDPAVAFSKVVDQSVLVRTGSTPDWILTNRAGEVEKTKELINKLLVTPITHYTPLEKSFLTGNATESANDVLVRSGYLPLSNEARRLIEAQSTVLADSIAKSINERLSYYKSTIEEIKSLPNLRQILDADNTPIQSILADTSITPYHKLSRQERDALLSDPTRIQELSRAIKKDIHEPVTQISFSPPEYVVDDGTPTPVRLPNLGYKKHVKDITETVPVTSVPKYISDTLTAQSLSSLEKFVSDLENKVFTKDITPETVQKIRFANDVIQALKADNKAYNFVTKYEPTVTRWVQDISNYATNPPATQAEYLIRKLKSPIDDPTEKAFVKHLYNSLKNDPEFRNAWDSLVPTALPRRASPDVKSYISSVKGLLDRLQSTGILTKKSREEFYVRSVQALEESFSSDLLKVISSKVSNPSLKTIKVQDYLMTPMIAKRYILALSEIEDIDPVFKSALAQSKIFNPLVRWVEKNDLSKIPPSQLAAKLAKSISSTDQASVKGMVEVVKNYVSLRSKKEVTESDIYNRIIQIADSLSSYASNLLNSLTGPLSSSVDSYIRTILSLKDTGLSIPSVKALEKQYLAYIKAHSVPVKAEKVGKKVKDKDAEKTVKTSKVKIVKPDKVEDTAEAKQKETPAEKAKGEDLTQEDIQKLSELSKKWRAVKQGKETEEKVEEPKSKIVKIKEQETPEPTPTATPRIKGKGVVKYPEVFVDYGQVTMSKGDLRRLVKNISKNWASRGSHIVIVDSYLDPNVPEEVKRTAGIETARGAHYNGKAYLFANRIENEEVARNVLFHEWYGHEGLNLINAKFEQLYDSLGYSEISRLANEYQINLEVIHSSVGTSEFSKAEFMEEFLSSLQEKVQTPSLSTTLKVFWGRIRNLLKKAGFVSESSVTESDLLYLLKKARTAAIRRASEVSTSPTKVSLMRYVVLDPTLSKISNLSDVSFLKRGVIQEDQQYVVLYPDSPRYPYGLAIPVRHYQSLLSNKAIRESGLDDGEVAVEVVDQNRLKELAQVEFIPKDVIDSEEISQVVENIEEVKAYHPNIVVQRVSLSLDKVLHGNEPANVFLHATRKETGEPVYMLKSREINKLSLLPPAVPKSLLDKLIKNEWVDIVSTGQDAAQKLWSGLDLLRFNQEGGDLLEIIIKPEHFDTVKREIISDMVSNPNNIYYIPPHVDIEEFKEPFDQAEDFRKRALEKLYGSLYIDLDTADQETVEQDSPKTLSLLKGEEVPVLPSVRGSVEVLHLLPINELEDVEVTDKIPAREAIDIALRVAEATDDPVYIFDVFDKIKDQLPDDIKALVSDRTVKSFSEWVEKHGQAIPKEMLRIDRMFHMVTEARLDIIDPKKRTVKPSVAEALKITPEIVKPDSALAISLLLISKDSRAGIYSFIPDDIKDTNEYTELSKILDRDENSPKMTPEVREKYHPMAFEFLNKLIFHKDPNVTATLIYHYIHPQITQGEVAPEPRLFQDFITDLSTAIPNRFRKLVPDLTFIASQDDATPYVPYLNRILLSLVNPSYIPLPKRKALVGFVSDDISGYLDQISRVKVLWRVGRRRAVIAYKYKSLMSPDDVVYEPSSRKRVSESERIRMIPEGSGYYEFSEEDFADRYSLGGLLSVLRKFGVIPSDSNITTVKDLNALLGSDDFYIKVINSRKKPPTAFLESLIDEYKDDPSKINLHKLNRLALEEYYPHVTPKVVTIPEIVPIDTETRMEMDEIAKKLSLDMIAKEEIPEIDRREQSPWVVTTAPIKDIDEFVVLDNRTKRLKPDPAVVPVREMLMLPPAMREYAMARFPDSNFNYILVPEDIHEYKSANPILTERINREIDLYREKYPSEVTVSRETTREDRLVNGKKTVVDVVNVITSVKFPNGAVFDRLVDTYDGTTYFAYFSPNISRSDGEISFKSEVVRDGSKNVKLKHLFLSRGVEPYYHKSEFKLADPKTQELYEATELSQVRYNLIIEEVKDGYDVSLVPHRSGKFVLSKNNTATDGEFYLYPFNLQTVFQNPVSMFMDLTEVGNTFKRRVDYNYSPIKIKFTGDGGLSIESGKVTLSKSVIEETAQDFHDVVASELQDNIERVVIKPIKEILKNSYLRQALYGDISKDGITKLLKGAEFSRELTSEEINEVVKRIEFLKDPAVFSNLLNWWQVEARSGNHRFNKLGLWFTYFHKLPTPPESVKSPAKTWWDVILAWSHLPVPVQRAYHILKPAVSGIENIFKEYGFSPLKPIYWTKGGDVIINVSPDDLLLWSRIPPRIMTNVELTPEADSMVRSLLYELGVDDANAIEKPLFKLNELIQGRLITGTRSGMDLTAVFTHPLYRFSREVYTKYPDADDSYVLSSKANILAVHYIAKALLKDKFSLESLVDDTMDVRLFYSPVVLKFLDNLTKPGDFIKKLPDNPNSKVLEELIDDLVSLNNLLIRSKGRKNETYIRVSDRIIKRLRSALDSASDFDSDVPANLSRKGPLIDPNQLIQVAQNVYGRVGNNVNAFMSEMQLIFSSAWNSARDLASTAWRVINTSRNKGLGIPSVSPSNGISHDGPVVFPILDSSMNILDNYLGASSISRSSDASSVMKAMKDEFTTDKVFAVLTNSSTGQIYEVIKEPSNDSMRWDLVAMKALTYRVYTNTPTQVWVGFADKSYGPEVLTGPIRYFRNLSGASVGDIILLMDNTWVGSKSGQVLPYEQSRVENVKDNPLALYPPIPNINRAGRFTRAEVQNIVDKITDKWASKGRNIIVVDSINSPEVPDEIRRTLPEEGAYGAHWKGKAYIFADQIDETKNITDTIAHEWFGHEGFAILRDELVGLYDKIGLVKLEQLAKKYNVPLKEIKADLAKRGFTVSSPDPIIASKAKAYITNELLAYMQQATYDKKIIRAFKAFIAKIRHYLRKAGLLTQEYSETDLFGILNKMRIEAIRRGFNYIDNTSLRWSKDVPHFVRKDRRVYEEEGLEGLYEVETEPVKAPDRADRSSLHYVTSPEYADLIQERYEAAIARHSDYRGNLRDHLLNQYGIIWRPYQSESVLAGQLVEDIFVVSHFAPSSLADGRRLLIEAYHSQMPMVFAVPEFLGNQLAKLGFHKIAEVPQWFAGEIIIKEVYVNKAFTSQDAQTLLSYYMSKMPDLAEEFSFVEASLSPIIQKAMTPEWEPSRRLAQRIVEPGQDLKTFSDTFQKTSPTLFERIKQWIVDLFNYAKNWLRERSFRKLLLKELEPANKTITLDFSGMQTIYEAVLKPKNVNDLVKKVEKEIEQALDDYTSPLYRKRYPIEEELEEAEEMMRNGQLFGRDLEAYLAYKEGRVTKETLMNNAVKNRNDLIYATLTKWWSYLKDNPTYDPAFRVAWFNKIASEYSYEDEKGNIKTVKFSNSSKYTPMEIDVIAIRRTYDRIKRELIPPKRWTEIYLIESKNVNQGGIDEKLEASAHSVVYGSVSGKWVYFPNRSEVSEEEHNANVNQLQALAQGTTWCTAYAAAEQLRSGAHWVFVDSDKKARATIFLINNNISQVRGILPGQVLEPVVVPIVRKFIVDMNLSGGETFVREEDLKAELIKIREEKGYITRSELSHLVGKYGYLDEFVDYGSGVHRSSETYVEPTIPHQDILRAKRAVDSGSAEVVVHESDSMKWLLSKEDDKYVLHVSANPQEHMPAIDIQVAWLGIDLDKGLVRSNDVELRSKVAVGESVNLLSVLGLEVKLGSESEVDIDLNELEHFRNNLKTIRTSGPHNSDVTVTIFADQNAGLDSFIGGPNVNLYLDASTLRIPSIHRNVQSYVKNIRSLRSIRESRRNEDSETIHITFPNLEEIGELMIGEDQDDPSSMVATHMPKLAKVGVLAIYGNYIPSTMGQIKEVGELIINTATLPLDDLGESLRKTKIGRVKSVYPITTNIVAYSEDQLDILIDTLTNIRKNGFRQDLSVRISFDVTAIGYTNSNFVLDLSGLGRIQTLITPAVPKIVVSSHIGNIDLVADLDSLPYTEIVGGRDIGHITYTVVLDRSDRDSHVIVLPDAKHVGRIQHLGHNSPRGVIVLAESYTGRTPDLLGGAITFIAKDGVRVLSDRTVVPNKNIPQYVASELDRYIQDHIHRTDDKYDRMYDLSLEGRERSESVPAKQVRDAEVITEDKYSEASRIGSQEDLSNLVIDTIANIVGTSAKMDLSKTSAELGRMATGQRGWTASTEATQVAGLHRTTITDGDISSVIYVASDVREKPLHAFHEAYHVVERLMRELAERAGDSKTLEMLNSLQQEFGDLDFRNMPEFKRNQYFKRYPILKGLYAVTNGNLTVSGSEHRAIAFSYFALNRFNEANKSWLSKTAQYIFDLIRNIIGRVRAALLKQSYYNPEQIFKKIYSGEIKDKYEKVFKNPKAGNKFANFFLPDPVGANFPPEAMLVSPDFILEPGKYPHLYTPDGKLAAEVPMDNVHLNLAEFRDQNGVLAAGINTTLPLSKVLTISNLQDLAHPFMDALYSTDVKVILDPKVTSPRGATYIARNHDNPDQKYKFRIVAVAGNVDDLRNVLLHEISHVSQALSDFSGGGSPRHPLIKEMAMKSFKAYQIFRKKGGDFSNPDIVRQMSEQLEWRDIEEQAAKLSGSKTPSEKDILKVLAYRWYERLTGEITAREDARRGFKTIQEISDPSKGVYLEEPDVKKFVTLNFDEFIAEASGWIEAAPPIEQWEEAPNPPTPTLKPSRMALNALLGELEKNNVQYKTTWQKFIDKIKEFSTNFKNQLTRLVPPLDPIKFPVENDIFRMAIDLPNKVAEETTNIIRNILKAGLSHEQYKTFSYYLVAEQILHRYETEGKGLELIFSDKFGFNLPFNIEQIAREAKVDHHALIKTFRDEMKAKVEADPVLRVTLATHYAEMRRLKKRFIDKGLIDPKYLDDDNYFHRIATEYLERTYFYQVAKNLRVGGKLSSQKPIKTNQDFLTDYVVSQYHFLYEYIFREQLLDFTEKFKQSADMMDKFKEEFARTIDAATRKMLDSYYRPEIERESMEKLEQGHFKKINDFMSEDPEINRQAWVERQIEKKIAKNIHIFMKDKFRDYVKKVHPDYEFVNLAEYNRVIKGFAIMNEEQQKKIIDLIHTVSEGSVNIPIEYIQSAAIIGPPIDEVLIHKDLHEALKYFKGELNKTRTALEIFLFKLGLWTKRWLLLSPMRILKWSLNNLSGDVDAAVSLEPKLIAYMATRPKMLKDVVHALFYYNFPDKRPTINPELLADIEKATTLGAVNSGLFIKEMEDITETVLDKLTQAKYLKRSDTFIQRALKNVVHDPLGTPGRIIKGYLKLVEPFINTRENVIRYMAFKYYQKSLTDFLTHLSDKYPNTPISTMPDSYFRRLKVGGSNKREIIGLLRAGYDTDRIAAKMASELVGDYGGVSALNRSISQYAIPFHRFTAINFYRYTNAFKNMAFDMTIDHPAALWRMMSILAMGVALGVRFSVFIFLLILINNTFKPREWEEVLDTHVSRGRLPLILGRTEDGKITTLRIEGAFSNILKWLDLEVWPYKLWRAEEMNVTPKSVLVDAGKGFVNQLLQGLAPVPKTFVEVAFGRSTFPDIFDMRPIRDPGEHISRLLAGESIWNAVVGKPGGRNLSKTIYSALGTYEIDPYEAAYFKSKRLAEKFTDSLGIDKPETLPSGRGNYLYYFKKALQVGDREAAIKYLTKYIENGGELRSVRESIQKEHPLSSIPVKYRKLFRESLNPTEAKVVDMAIKWHTDIYKAEPKFSPGELTEIRRLALEAGRPVYKERVESFKAEVRGQL